MKSSRVNHHISGGVNLGAWEEHYMIPLGHCRPGFTEHYLNREGGWKICKRSKREIQAEKAQEERMGLNRYITLGDNTNTPIVNSTDLYSQSSLPATTPIQNSFDAKRMLPDRSPCSGASLIQKPIRYDGNGAGFPASHHKTNNLNRIY